MNNFLTPSTVKFPIIVHFVVTTLVSRKIALSHTSPSSKSLLKRSLRNTLIYVVADSWRPRLQLLARMMTSMISEMSNKVFGPNEQPKSAILMLSILFEQTVEHVEEEFCTRYPTSYRYGYRFTSIQSESPTGIGRPTKEKQEQSKEKKKRRNQRKARNKVAVEHPLHSLTMRVREKASQLPLQMNGAVSALKPRHKSSRT
ncbi:hypothetical protein ACE6H2_010309 [Prunus campanulata]